MERRHDGRLAESLADIRQLLPRAAKTRDAHGGVQQGLRRRVAQRDDGLRGDDLQLAHQVVPAGLDFLDGRRAVSGRAALDDVADEHVVSFESHGLDHLVEQLSGAPDERSAGGVLLHARRLADEDQVGVGICLTEDGLCPPLAELASRAVPDLADVDGLERLGLLLGRHGGAGCGRRACG